MTPMSLTVDERRDPIQETRANKKKKRHKLPEYCYQRKDRKTEWYVRPKNVMIQAKSKVIRKTVEIQNKNINQVRMCLFAEFIKIQV